ncbi:uncharacterized protein LOC130961000 isoform X4 [Arachis stenosperma]|uniref:uncharacterized protein LOC130961000 isoform X4 n=1 Tax=Arachis stenosperma TaxID=217475 RepID=UPI0025ABA2D3|nr:uncharacterized protein LOC130961000 isoform X4 [Arachis stenosperma]
MSIPDFLQERVFDAVAGFLTEQVNYVWDYEKRFDDVSKVVENLKNDRDEVRDRAKEEEGRYGRAIYDNVLEWLARVDEIVVKYNKFKEDHNNNAGYALAFPFQNLDIRYRQSKIAERIKEEAENLQNEKRDRISRWQGPPSSMGYALPSVEYEELNSRKQNMEDVKKALEDSSATMVGVHGLAGMGKTTLVIKAINTLQSREPKLFDMVIMANVGKNPDIRKIQGQIADMLGITLQEESEYARAIRIRDNLKKGKNTLIILDDMYAKMDLDKLGISSESGDDKKNLILKQGIKSSNPSGAAQTKEETKTAEQKSEIDSSGRKNLRTQKSIITEDHKTRTGKKIEDTSSGSSQVGKAAQENQKGCKVLLISEAKQVLYQMNVNANSIIFVDAIKPEDDDDAKKLFKKKAGIADDDKNSNRARLAIEIAKKCSGLPMSIETLKTLERKKLTGTSEYSTKLSYQLLENEELKRIFLLCACLGQDALVSDLVRLCIGLGFLEGIYTVRDGRDQVQMLLMHLEESGLLSNSYSNDRFTMQNLIRNAALLIASENNVFVRAKRKLDEWPDDDKLRQYTAIFLHHCDVNTEFPKSLKCSKLRVFHFHNDHQHFKIPKDFFGGMEELRVLVLLGIDLSEMSSSMKYLTKLRKLCLEQCINLDENLCIHIGKFMKNLRILSFSGSDIKSLPTKLKDLSKLQILDLSNCSQLKSIQAGVISSLTNLEELYMRNTLVEWRVDNREETENKNASLSELGHLSQITNVDLQIPSVAHLPENLFFDKLHSYKIVIGSSSTHLEPDFKIPEKYQLLRYLAILEKDVGIHSQKGIKMLFERVENLLLEELNGVQDIFYALNLKGFPCLKTLSIVSTSSIRYLINPQERKHPENAFPKLETLQIYKLDNMEQLCSRVSLSSSSFCKLKVVKIKLCGLLKNVFLMSMVKLLVALQTIEVSECNSLKEIVFAEDNAQDKPLELQELRTLTLKSLPEFHGFCSISSTAQQKVLFDEQVEFSKLERLELCSIQIHQIWNGKNPPFGKLVHLEVNGCDNLKSLLTLSMAINMKTLQSLSVSECDNMMHILPNENSNDTQSEKKPRRCISSVRRQQGMRLDERYVPYLQMAGLYHLARLNDRWFRLDEPLVSAFVERWRPETHTFHMPFGECTITLQDVAYQLGLPVDGDYVSGCLTDFHLYIEGGRPAWQWFHELLGVLPPENQVQKFAVNCTWFQETFAECPDGADEETVRRFARGYIMMLLGTQLFADKSGNRIHIRWLPYVARLEEMGRYSWASAALAWLYRCMCRVANRHVVKLADPLQLLQSWIFWRFSTLTPSGYDEISWPLASRWSGYNPEISNKGPRVQMARMKIDLLQPRQFI